MGKERYCCVVVDDHVDFIEQLTEYIDKFGAISILKTFSNPVDFLNEIDKSIMIDFLFLDIEMPSINGLVLAKKIRENVNNLIFISAYPKYAIDAFNVSANGFLPKPVSYDKFETLLSTLIDKMEKEPIAL